MSIAERVDVIATTTSGSISDWGKVQKIVPQFTAQGFQDVRLHVVDTHAQACDKACYCLREGGRALISAGGSGTFRAVVEGCLMSGVPVDQVCLGFLRKGSADLIGKALGIPDEVELAVEVLASALKEDRTEPCDVLLAQSGHAGSAPRPFVGYGGAEIFGRIPRFTETRVMKWYKGVLGQLCGDLGPFSLGLGLAVLEYFFHGTRRGRGTWTITADGKPSELGRLAAILIVNGYLGPDLPLSSDRLGSGRFHVYVFSDPGILKIPRLALAALKMEINKDPGRWGMRTFTATREVQLSPSNPGPFVANIDGATFVAEGALIVTRAGSVKLLSTAGSEAPAERDPKPSNLNRVQASILTSTPGVNSRQP